MSASQSTGATLWFPAYVALGSNLDDPRAQVESAFSALAKLPGTRLIALIKAPAVHLIPR